MDPQKVSTVLDWACSISFCHVKSFLGFYNFYWPFIWDFSKFAKYLTSFIKKDIFFNLSLAWESAFRNLKEIVTEALILANYKQNLKIIVETDLSDYVSSEVFFQLSKNRLLYLVAFFSKNLNLAEYNYEIYNKVLLPIIWYFEQWRPELEGTKVLIKVIIDDKSLEYFMTTKKLTAKILLQFNFIISCTVDKDNAKADTFIRYSNDILANNYNDWQQCLLQTILLSERLEISSIDAKRVYTTPERVIQANLIDLYYTKLNEAKKTSSSIESINACHFSDLSIDNNNCIC